MTYNNRICKCIFQHNAATPFRSIFSASESDDLIALCKNVFNRSFTNGIGVRLDYCNQENQASMVQTLGKCQSIQEGTKEKENRIRTVGDSFLIGKQLTASTTTTLSSKHNLEMRCSI